MTKYHWTSRNGSWSITRHDDTTITLTDNVLKTSCPVDALTDQLPDVPGDVRQALDTALHLRPRIVFRLA